jgi:hypothetical protein
MAKSKENISFDKRSNMYGKIESQPEINISGYKCDYYMQNNLNANVI